MAVLLLVLVIGSVLSVPSPRDHSEVPKCGYKSCTKPKDGMLNVHIVAHTHDDVGWLKTVDQYYYGHRNNIQKAGVQYILDSVVKELWEDPARRFIYVETAFFAKWWHEQSENVKAKVQTLVQEGRLKFAGGAWSMNDEAATYYQSTIDQFTYGLSFLNDTFGECGRPRVGWQIDPFGHSREFASNLAAMGYDGLFLGRIDYQDKSNRMKNKEMEFIWRGDDSLGKSSDIFTGILYNTYSPPPGFCFDVLCNDEPIIDDPSSPDYNVNRRVSDFLKVTKHMSEAYVTNNLLVTMGEDFQYQLADMWFKNLDKLINHYGDEFNYQDAGMWFKNLDKLIKYGNEKAIEEKLNINIFYSTPDCYLKAVKDANPTLPVKQDDFFPYASDPHSYWTGYFTSRPTIKFIEAEANRYMQIVKQLYVLADLPADDMPVLDKLKSAMGVLQHHDAITGTEKQHVTYDYIRLISEALHDAHDTITTKVLNKMIHGKAANVQWTFDKCQLNESSCVTSENLQGNMIVTLYNPLAWPVRTPVNIPVNNSEEYEMKDSNGIVYPVQTSPIPDGFKRISTRKSKATHQITFVAPVPALGYKSYYIQKSRQRRDKRDVDSLDGAMRYNTFGYDEVMSDDPMVVQRYDEVADEAILSTIDKKDERISGHTLSYNPAYYPACLGNNMIYANRSSGAYIFRPNATNATPLKTLTDTQITGNIFEEHRSIMSDNFEFYNRVYKDANNLTYNELYWLIGPIVDTDGVGKEYVMKYTADLVTNGEFMTDSNGRTLLKRKLNERPQWNLTLEEPVAGNYYPVVGVAIVENAAKDGSLRIVPDRPEGGASLQEGQIEIMLHRRLLHDDAFGVGEALNETVNGVGLVVTGYQRVFGVNNDKFSFKDVLEMRSKPDVFVTDAEDISYEQFKSLNTEKSWLKDGLEVGVHLLTLEPLSGDRFLIRFENYLDKSSDSTKNIDLDKVIKGFKLRSVDETVLSGDKLLKDYNRWVWRTNKEFAKDFNEDYGSFAETPRAVDRVKEVDDGNKIKLDAKEIRTFIVQYELE